jgi:hypothetical protein
MGQELTQVPCPQCGTSGDADPGLSRWQCTSCGNGYFLRRCSACARVSYVDGLQGFRLPWPCTWCGHFNSGFSQNQDPAAASAAELAAELTRLGPPGSAAGDGPGRQAGPGPDSDGGPPPDREPADREPGDREPGDREPGDREPADREPGDREPADREPDAAAGAASQGPADPLPVPALPPYRPAYYPPRPAYYPPGPPDPPPGFVHLSPGPAHPPGGQAAEPTRPDGRRARRVGLSAAVAVAVACAAAAAALLTTRHPGAAAMPAARALAQTAATRPVLFTAGQVASIDFQGIAGQLVIAGTGSRQVTLTGKLRGNGGAPSVETRFDHATGALTMSIRCPAAAQCTQDLRLAVPDDAGTTVRQSGGQVTVTGLAGPLCITAANAAVSASGLRSARLTAVITNGRLSAAFSAPPRQVGISLVSAQATVRLPASAAYQVTKEVTSGYIKAAIPQASDAARTVTARVHSGELELLPS